MSTADDSELYCRYEAKSFPDTQFSEDPEWGKVHDVHPRHTVNGTIVNKKRPGPRFGAAPKPKE